MSDNHDVIISSDAIFCLPFYKFNSFKNFMQTTKLLYSINLENHTLLFCLALLTNIYNATT